MKKKITKALLDSLKPGEQITDTETRGFRARCLPSGLVKLSLRCSVDGGARHELPLGIYGTVTVEQARRLAVQKAGEVASGRNPAAERKVRVARSENTVNVILDKWLANARTRRVRTIRCITNLLKRHVRPAIGDVVIYDLDRGQVVAMLTTICSTTMSTAHRARAHLGSALNWWRENDARFVTLPMPGRKFLPKEEVRDRVLDLDEIRDLWTALGELKSQTNYPALVRTLLLTACRRDEVGVMHTSEFEGGDWIIPKERYKTGKEHLIPLIPAIKKLLPADANGFVFPGRGRATPFTGHTRAKHRLDRKINEVRKRNGRKPMAHWVLHDLRRTARTRMAEIGIADNIAELLLGHQLTGIKKVYNRHDYRAEKIEALTRWTNWLDGIVHPSPTKVVALRPARAARRKVGG